MEWDGFLLGKEKVGRSQAFFSKKCSPLRPLVHLRQMHSILGCRLHVLGTWSGWGGANVTVIIEPSILMP